MSLDALVADWGAPALVLGGLLEGDTVGILGGAAAHRGALGFWEAAAAVGIGAALADQGWFHAARRGREHKMVRRIAKSAAAERVSRLIERRPVIAVASFRFVPGMRTVGPVALGLSTVPARLYVPVNLLSVAVWAILVTAIGFGGSRLVQHLVGELALHVHLAILLAICLALWSIWTFVRR